MPTLTKAALAALLLNLLDLSKQEAKNIVDTFFDLIGTALKSGQSVKLPGFGTFRLRNKRARPGFNLQTGEVMLIKPRCVVVFYASQKLKKRVASLS